MCQLLGWRKAQSRAASRSIAVALLLLRSTIAVALSSS
jgi:hypothetical protein